MAELSGKSICVNPMHHRVANDFKDSDWWHCSSHQLVNLLFSKCMGFKYNKEESSDLTFGKKTFGSLIDSQSA